MPALSGALGGGSPMGGAGETSSATSTATSSGTFSTGAMSKGGTSTPWLIAGGIALLAIVLLSRRSHG